MEDVNALSQVSHTFHCGVDPGGPCNETTGISSDLLACGGCQTGYHTYSVIVDRTNTSAEQLRFYTDGNLQLDRQREPGPRRHLAGRRRPRVLHDPQRRHGRRLPQRICNCTSPTSATSSGAGMSVDYVAVYQTGGSTSTPSRRPALRRRRPRARRPPAVAAAARPAPRPPPSNISADCFSASQGGVSVTPATGDTNPSGVDGNQAAQLANGKYLEYGNVNFGSGGRASSTPGSPPARQAASAAW